MIAKYLSSIVAEAAALAPSVGSARLDRSLLLALTALNCTLPNANR